MPAVHDKNGCSESKFQSARAIALRQVRFARPRPKAPHYPANRHGFKRDGGVELVPSQKRQMQRRKSFIRKPVPRGCPQGRKFLKIGKNSGEPVSEQRGNDGADALRQLVAYAGLPGLIIISRFSAAIFSTVSPSSVWSRPMFIRTLQSGASMTFVGNKTPAETSLWKRRLPQPRRLKNSIAMAVTSSNLLAGLPWKAQAARKIR